jgi:hypothetical protein
MSVPAPNPSPVPRFGEPTRRIVATVCWVAVVAVIVQSAANLADFAFFDGDIKALNADEEQNAFAWASSVSTFAAGFFLLLPAVAAEALDRMTVALVSAIMFFSLDDAIALHERLADRSVEIVDLEITVERIAWPILYLPALVLVFVMLLRMARASSYPIATLIKAGLALLVAAIFAETTSAFYIGDADLGTWRDVLEVTFEEGAELAGWILIAAALAARAYLLAEWPE